MLLRSLRVVVVGLLCKDGGVFELREGSKGLSVDWEGQKKSGNFRGSRFALFRPLVRIDWRVSGW